MKPTIHNGGIYAAWKKYIAVVLVFFSGSMTQTLRAQEDIRSIVVEEHDSVWYIEQELAWERVLSASPQDEHAWRNLFEAVYYQDRFFNGYKSEATRHLQVVERMKNAIPDTYTYNICMCRTLMGDGSVAPYANAALRLLPDDVRAEDKETLLGWLWMSGAADTPGSEGYISFRTLLRQQYEAVRYPSYILRYCFNQFQGMDNEGIYFGNGDVALFPAILLQQALNVHTDKIVIAVPFLLYKDYTDGLCKRLGIAPFETKEVSDDPKKYRREVVDYIIKESGRAAYFHPGAWEGIEGIEENLYSEGLLLRYSKKRYDNLSATMSIVENKYHLDYLTEPAFIPEEWWSGSRLQLNYVVMLSHVITAYNKEGKTIQANRLARVLRSSVVNTQLPDAVQRKYLALLDKAMSR